MKLDLPLRADETKLLYASATTARCSSWSHWASKLEHQLRRATDGLCQRRYSSRNIRKTAYAKSAQEKCPYGTLRAPHAPRTRGPQSALRTGFV